MNLQTMVGTRVFYKKGSAEDWTELPGIEETSGGGISNSSDEYTPHDTGIKQKYLTAQEYDDVNINVAKDVGTSAYANETVRILNDLAKKREAFELAKAVPAANSSYEVTVWSGYVSKADVDDASADNLQRGSFTIAVSSRTEYTGKIEDNKLTLTLRS